MTAETLRPEQEAERLNDRGRYPSERRLYSCLALQLDHALYCARGWVKPPSLTWTGLP